MLGIEVGMYPREHRFMTPESLWVLSEKIWDQDTFTVSSEAIKSKNAASGKLIAGAPIKQNGKRASPKEEKAKAGTGSKKLDKHREESGRSENDENADDQEEEEEQEQEQEGEEQEEQTNEGDQEQQD